MRECRVFALSDIECTALLKSDMDVAGEDAKTQRKEMDVAAKHGMMLSPLRELMRWETSTQGGTALTIFPRTVPSSCSSARCPT
jgi:hypothetical protein